MAQLIPAQVGGQPVLILREGSSRSKGKEAQRNNIQAAKVVANVVKSALGPKGMDKMLVDSSNEYKNFRNNKKSKANWQFTTIDARIRLSKLYPTLDD